MRCDWTSGSIPLRFSITASCRPLPAKLCSPPVSFVRRPWPVAMNERYESESVGACIAERACSSVACIRLCASACERTRISFEGSVYLPRPMEAEHFPEATLASYSHVHASGFPLSPDPVMVFQIMGQRGSGSKRYARVVGEKPMAFPSRSHASGISNTISECGVENCMHFNIAGVCC